ncbi:hypothetical protein DSC45_35410 [Streptomyces sp. YIM 130001]|uniref:hypothetical protein n=1 Tax=Streptomyces sp. YIM 130001 TaxID=2259644 RepID=UPI000ED26A2D|nr:hypothetical protein [Streptomyces sp. YIM 130001]RII06821.1 hypothetical protein DSC45_35410 [Streptomyces sp. YIM 130001]
MMNPLKRALVAAGVTAAAVLTPVAIATPATAASTTSVTIQAWGACFNHVEYAGYTAGPKVIAACKNRATNTGVGWFPNPHCVKGLTKIGVRAEVAQNACSRAH